jgi:hypothetical protein
MTLELRKFQLIEFIMSVRDEKLLVKYEEMMRKARIEAYEASLKPMTVNELRERALAAEKDIKEGRGIDIDDLQKEMENW